ncbi:EmrB/QacA family drug resistance transporter [Endozoicomonas sp. OPT23]|nr:EmrB/QacA family drug resistance transporter [Endozoicomonas sp. OPT23]
MLAMLRYALDEEPMRLDLLKQADWAGIATLSIGLASLEFVLEEGNRNNWFESHEIAFISVVSAVSLVSFVWFQLTRDNPLLNLRILKDRQFFLGNLANCAIGLGMYGSVFLLPMYLSSIQNYNALQIGEVMLWGGLPQLLLIPLIPLIPRLMQFIDKRWLCLFGLLMFAISVYQNAFMTADYSGDQFRFSLVLRAIGQPFIMVTLSVIALEKLEMKDIYSASSLYNTSRNLSGAVGIAILSTMVDRRGTLHELRISEGISLFDANTQEYLSRLKEALPSLSQQQDLALLMGKVSKDATIMAFSDAFLVIAVSLFMGFLAVMVIGSGTKEKSMG